MYSFFILIHALIGNRSDSNWIPEKVSIDYRYLRSSFIQQVNDLLCLSFWPGINGNEQSIINDIDYSDE